MIDKDLLEDTLPQLKSHSISQDTFEPRHDLTLAQHIRRGATLGRQLHGAYWQTLDSDELASCGVGAAIISMTGNSVSRDYSGPAPVLCSTSFNERYQQKINVEWLEETLPGIKSLDYGPRTHVWLTYVIERLNDELRWTRNEIADWLEETGICEVPETMPRVEETTNETSKEGDNQCQAKRLNHAMI